jgi:phosphate transport system substrate-binding protein
VRNHTAKVVAFGRLLALAMASTVMLSASLATAAEVIKIGGTGNALGTMQLLADAFVKESPDIRITVVPSLGTSGAIKALPKGALDIGLSSRPLTEEERRLGVNAVEYARSALVFAVAPKTQVFALTLSQVADIYSGKMVTWADCSLIRPVMRPAGDDNSRQIKAMSAALDSALSAAEQRPGAPFAASDQEAAEKMEGIPGAVGSTTLSLILSEHRALRALTLDGVEPTARNLASGKYPHIKRFFYITSTSPSPAVKRFVAWLQSPTAREILIRNGHGIT